MTARGALLNSTASLARLPKPKPRRPVVCYVNGQRRLGEMREDGWVTLPFPIPEGAKVEIHYDEAWP